MSLFESASLVVTPNGTKASKLYAIKPTDGSGDLTVTRATTATRVNSSGLISSVASNVPRLDYSNGTCPSILVEPQRTNLVTYSSSFDNGAWTKENVTITANSTISPDGTSNADSLIENTLNDAHYIDVRPTVTNANHSVSIYVKANGRTKFQLREGSNGDVSAFDLNNPSGNIKSVGNGWFRVVLTTTPASTTFIFQLRLLDNSGNLVYTGNGTSGLYIWGAQLEAGSYATSYIPTTSASVTRNADVISKTGISSLIGQTEGTIYAEVKVSKLIGTASRYIFHISDGTVNNRIYMAFSGSSSNVLRGRIFSGGTLQCSIDTSTLTNTGTYKIALAYKNNDIVFYVNGVQIGTDTSATIPTCSRVDLGHNYAGASQFSDSINNANIWKTRLSNSELETLTTI
jgi:hypothetical protein